MLPFTISHDSYKSFFTDQLRSHYTGEILKLLPADWLLIEKLWLTDLSATAEFLKHQYHRFGPRPTDPASLLRSFLLMLFTQRGYSITAWVDELRRVPLYAILSGFEPQNTPGIGTFYDFFRHLWASQSANSKPHEKFKRQKPKKGKGKGEKSFTTSVGKINKWVQRVLRYEENGHFSPKPYDRLFSFFEQAFLSVSMDRELLGLRDHLSIAGDGTPVVTASLLRSKSLCDCRAQSLENCHHKRFFSQPDTNSGWDSSRERYFNGYHLYMFTASDSPHDLPVFHPASAGVSS